jgi:hypothetical protein
MRSFRRLRPVAALAALVVAASVSIVPAAATEDSHAMPCCVFDAACATLAFVAPCCDQTRPADVLTLTASGPARLEPYPSRDQISAGIAIPPVVAVGSPSASLPFERSLLNRPHAPPYLKNASLRI